MVNYRTNERPIKKEKRIMYITEDEKLEIAIDRAIDEIIIEILSAKDKEKQYEYDVETGLFTDLSL